VSPGEDLFLREPESDLVVGRLNGIRSVDHVTANIDAVVSSDGSGARVSRSGGSEHNTASSDSVVSFPNHGADGSRDHVVNETGEEFLS